MTYISLYRYHLYNYINDTYILYIECFMTPQLQHKVEESKSR